MHAHHLENQAIEIVATQLTTDQPSTFDSRSAMELVGYSMSKDAADKAFAQAGFNEGEGRDLVGVVELHDCFAANEVTGTTSDHGNKMNSDFVAHHLSCIRALCC